MKQKKTVKAVKAATRLIKYCRKHTCCDKCIFYKGIEYKSCAVNFPHRWTEITGVNDEHISN